MTDLDSNLFTTWTDPESGVAVHVLTHKVAPVQEAFYFVNDSMSADGRYLWFYCAYPPSGSAAQGRTLGVVDFERGEVRHYPETQFSDATPYVDVDSGEAYWGSGMAVWRRGPGADDAPVEMNALPRELVGGRGMHKLATHLTRSADGKAFFIDTHFGLQRVFGALPVDGGPFEVWQRFDRNHNHAQFNPVDPDLVLFAEEFHSDPITGLRFPITDRMWLIRRGEQGRPLLDTPTVLTHEWWDVDGRHAWCVKPTLPRAAWRIDVETREVDEILWPNLWHAHSSRDGTYIVGDETSHFYRGCPSTVSFLNRETGKRVRVAANLEIPGLVGATYHIDPHPRFCCGDRFVVFTTTVLGEVDLGVVRTEELVGRTE